MGGRLEMNRGLLWLNSLIYGAGRGRSFQGEAISMIGDCLDYIGENGGMETVTFVFAMDANPYSSTGGFRMAFRSLACQPGLRDLPEVNLLFGAERSLGGNGPAGWGRGNRIDFPHSGIEVRNRFRRMKNWPTDK